MSQEDPTPDELLDDAFVAYVRSEFPPDGKVQPDPQDYDPSARAETIEGQAAEYRLAQTRKIVRILREWTAQQN
jgi:hypothetical protein